MKLSEAARTWAAEVLKEHFRGSDDREYRSRHSRIGCAVTARLQLGTEKVRAELGSTRASAEA